MSHHKEHHDEPHFKEKNHPERLGRLPFQPRWLFMTGFGLILLCMLVWVFIRF